MVKKFSSIKIAVVNSNSFGIHFNEHIKRLSGIGKIRKIVLDKNISEKILAESLKGFQAIIASVTPYYGSCFFNLNKDVILISRHGIGINNVDIKSATKAGVLVTKVSGYIEKEAMAEHAVTLLLQVARKINPALQAVKNGMWKERARFLGIEVKARTIGIIGMGNIGSRVVEILKNGFGAEILVYDPNVSGKTAKRNGASKVEIDYLLKKSDIISLHASLNKDNYHMLGKKEFSLMKDGVIIINTARGELIDEKVFIENLGNGKIAGAGLDVVEGEPIGKNHPLLKFPNVVIVPHIGAYTVESLRKMGDKVVDDIEKVLVKNKIPDELVNPEVLKKPIRGGIKL